MSARRPPAPRRVRTTDGRLDWTQARLGESAPCAACGTPALLRHPETQQPHHRVCDGQPPA